jgi:hypothetical protein
LGKFEQVTSSFRKVYLVIRASGDSRSAFGVCDPNPASIGRLNFIFLKCFLYFVVSMTHIIAVKQLKGPRHKELFC